MTLPEPYTQHAPVGQPQPDADQYLAHAVEEAIVKELAKTFHRDESPLPVIGDAPPVAQPGRPPMSQKATDASALMLAGGAATVMVGGGASLVMLASGYADPTVCAIILGGPVVLVLAISRLVRRAKEVVEAAPATHHHHYQGDVTIDQRSINSRTRGVIASTRNQG